MLTRELMLWKLQVLSIKPLHLGLQLRQILSLAVYLDSCSRRNYRGKLLCTLRFSEIMICVGQL